MDNIIIKRFIEDDIKNKPNNNIYNKAKYSEKYILSNSFVYRETTITSNVDNKNTYLKK